MSNKWNKQPGLLKKPKVCISPPPPPPLPEPECSATFDPNPATTPRMMPVTAQFLASDDELPMGENVAINWTADFHFSGLNPTVQNNVPHTVQFNGSGTVGTWEAKADATFSNGCTASGTWTVNVTL